MLQAIDAPLVDGAAPPLPVQQHAESFTLLHGREGKPVASARALGRSKLNLAQYAGVEAMSKQLALVLLQSMVMVAVLVETSFPRCVSDDVHARQMSNDICAAGEGGFAARAPAALKTPSRLRATFERSAGARAIDVHRADSLLLLLKPKSRTAFEHGGVLAQ